VELLWRRAEGDARKVRSGKLYMLVSAELLDYDISCRVENSLEKHSHAVHGQFSVVLLSKFICKSDEKFELRLSVLNC